MAPRVPVDEDGLQVSIIHNHGTKVLAIYDKSQCLHILSNFHWKFITELKDSGLDMVGYLVGIKVLFVFLSKSFLIFFIQVFPPGEVVYVYIDVSDLYKVLSVKKAIQMQTKHIVWMDMGKFTK